MTSAVLEPEAQKVADLTASPPFLYQLGPDGARKVLDDIQAAPIDKPEVADEWITVPAEVGDVRVRIVKPVRAPAVLPVVLYIHGGGWILGNAGTHDRLVRELAVGAGAAVVFVDFYEYFHGDTGRGIGASHQTGWTALVSTIHAIQR